VVRTTDGKEYSEYLEYPKGDPREPMTMEDLQAKFNALSDALLSTGRQKQLEEIIFGCDRYTARNFMRELVA
jgi:2-methylcitrate dehydratase